MSKPITVQPGVQLRDADKMALIPVKFMPEDEGEQLKNLTGCVFVCLRQTKRSSTSKTSCGKIICIPSAKKPPARICQNVLTMAPRLS